MNVKGNDSELLKFEGNGDRKKFLSFFEMKLDLNSHSPKTKLIKIFCTLYA